jgi:hypothetical protein
MMLLVLRAEPEGETAMQADEDSGETGLSLFLLVPAAAVLLLPTVGGG